MKKTIKKKKEIKIDPPSFEQRIKAYIVHINKVATDLELKVEPIINWKKGKPNTLGKFAIYLLKLSGAKLDTKFTNLKK